MGKRNKKFYCGSMKRKSDGLQQGESNPLKKRKANLLEPGVKGVLLTCNREERACALDGYKLLAEYADAIYGPEFEVPEVSNARDTASQLNNEIAAMSTERRFQQLNCKLKNVLFIQANVPSISVIVDKIFQDAYYTKQRKSKAIIKIFPVLGTSRPTATDIKICLRSVLEQFRPSDYQPSTYWFESKVRNFYRTTHLELDHSIRVEVPAVKPFWRLQKHKPDYTIFFNVFRSACCISILGNYDMYKKYNLHELVNEGESSNTTVRNVARNEYNCGTKAIDYVQLCSIQEKENSQQVAYVKQESDDTVEEQLNVGNIVPECESVVNVKQESNNLLLHQIESVSQDSTSVQQGLNVRQESVDSLEQHVANVEQECESLLKSQSESDQQEQIDSESVASSSGFKMFS